tara:strand:- start:16 stop:351 length:336 start_codon:yes stop_codon:yes gene_type:complete
MGDKENDKTLENEVRITHEQRDIVNALTKASNLIKDQTNLIALLRTKITQLSTRCTDLYKANLNLEEINKQHKKLNGELHVELSSLKPKGIKLSYDTNQPEKETTVFGTKI